MAIQFRKATKKQAKLRAALIGPSGSGKTFTGLRLARGLVGPNGRVALADSEAGSAEKYAGVFDFETVHLQDFSPKTYIEAIKAAEAAGFDALVIDSLSHAWSGKGGALELVDQARARSKSKDGFGAWREVTPLHNELIDTILRAKLHIIATMRAKTEWVLEKDDNGKNHPRKIGLAPVQRDGMEYEFDLVGDLDDAQLVITKSRIPGYAKAVIKEPGEELGAKLAAWLNEGEKSAPLPAVAPDAYEWAGAMLAEADAETFGGVLVKVKALMADRPEAEKQAVRTLAAKRQQQLGWKPPQAVKRGPIIDQEGDESEGEARARHLQDRMPPPVDDDKPGNLGGDGHDYDAPL